MGETDEEQSWSDYERGHKNGDKEGYDRGIRDFIAVERLKAEIRAKGIPVVGDIKMDDKTRNGVIKILKDIMNRYVVYEGYTMKEIQKMIDELEALECPTYEVV